MDNSFLMGVLNRVAVFVAIPRDLYPPNEFHDEIRPVGSAVLSGQPHAAVIAREISGMTAGVIRSKK